MLFLSGNEITSLTCLSQFKALKELYVSKNKLQSLKGIENQSLTTLDCLSNKIVSLKPINGKCLKHLSLSKNALNNIEELNLLSGYGCLETLYLSENTFSTAIKAGQLKSVLGSKITRVEMSYGKNSLREIQKSAATPFESANLREVLKNTSSKKY